MYIKKHVTGNVLSNDDSGQVHRPYKVKRLYRGDSSKHDKRGACDSFVACLSPNFHARSYYIRLRLRVAGNIVTSATTTTVRKREEGLFFSVYLRKLNVEGAGDYSR